MKINDQHLFEKTSKNWYSERDYYRFLFLTFHNKRAICNTCQKYASFYLALSKKYVSSCGHAIFPKKNTIFYNSSTSLKKWFYVVHLFSIYQTKLTAKDVERQIEVTYKTAWRILNRVKKLALDDPTLFSKIADFMQNQTNTN